MGGCTDGWVHLMKARLQMMMGWEPSVLVGLDSYNRLVPKASWQGAAL